MNDKKELANFCRNVERLKDNYDLSDRQMMKIMHVSYGTLKSIKNGVVPNRISADVLFYLNNYFKVDIASLFTEKYKIER